MVCRVCHKRAYSDYCVRHKPRKPITQRGKQYKKYQSFKTLQAHPYLTEKYGRVCSVIGCMESEVDIDHIEERGSRPDLKYELTNLRYVCRPHHRLITDGVKMEFKYDNPL